MIRCLAITVFLLTSCASEVRDTALNDYTEKSPVSVLDAPSIAGASVSPSNRDEVDHGEYLVELLGCGACHTDGALVGRPDTTAPLSGSDIGIAFTTPLLNKHPAVVYAPNITPDHTTGIGGWNEHQIVDAFREGNDRHGGSLAPVMPWPGYSILSDNDAYAIASYLQHIEPVKHRVPANVPQGEIATGHYVYFGVYEKK